MSDMICHKVYEFLMSILIANTHVLYYTTISARCEQTWRYELQTLRLLQMKTLANSINSSLVMPVKIYGK